MEGPEVSLKGSPTVSPTTAAACASDAFTAVVAFFNVLLRIVPCTAGIGHEDSHHNTCYQSTCKQAAQCINAQQQTNYQRSCNCHDTGNQHFLQCCCCGNCYAVLVVGLACTFHDAGDSTELSSYFFDHLKCSFPYGLHCECGEQEGQHTTDQQTDDNTRIQHVDCGQSQQPLHRIRTEPVLSVLRNRLRSLYP